MATETFIHPTAEVSPQATVGTGTKIWNFAQVREGAALGAGCILGKDVYIDRDVSIGNGVKIQNSVSVYQGVTVEDEVFIGPHVVFTNDLYPRADCAHWQVVPTVVKRGASIGANATIVCGVTIGEGAMVGAGAVVTRDVPPLALVVGNPARVLRWLQSGSAIRTAPIPVMLIGYGRMGANHARTLAGLPDDFSLRTIAEPDPAGRELAAKRHPGVQLVSDWREGLAQVTAAVIATPTRTHLAIAERVLQAGRHCLLEKPCALSAGSASRLYSLATEQGLVLQVGHSERFNPAILALQQAITDQEIMAISTERLGSSSSADDIVFDLAIHDLELTQALVQQPATAVLGKGTADSYATAIVEFADQSLATLTVSRITPWRRRIVTVTTPQAVYVADCLAETLTVHRLTVGERRSTGGTTSSLCQMFAGDDALTRQAIAFAASVRCGAEPQVNSRTVLPALQLAEAISMQLERSR